MYTCMLLNTSASKMLQPIELISGKYRKFKFEATKKVAQDSNSLKTLDKVRKTGG